MKFFTSLLTSLTALLFLILFTTPPALSEELPPGVMDFVHSYLEAAKKNAAPMIRQLSHPAFLDCEEMKKSENYDLLVSQQTKPFSTEEPVLKIQYKAFSDEDRKQMSLNLNKRKMEWPVSPDGMVIVMYSSYHKIRKGKLIVSKTDNDWKWLHFCKKQKQEEPSNDWFWSND